MRPRLLDPDAAEQLAHRLRGPLNTLVIWSAVLQRQLQDAPPLVQRSLAGLCEAVEEQVRIIEELERAAAAETSTAAAGPEKPGPRHLTP
jgi:signal transduction histidine kinase